MTPQPAPSDPAVAIARLLADLDPPLVTGEAVGAASGPPDRLRSLVLRRARDRAVDASLPDRADLPAAACAYADQVRALDAMVAGLSVDQWQLPVVNAWTPDRVLGHLAAVDAAAAAALGLPTPAQTGEGTDVRARTKEVFAALATSEPAAWHRLWRAQAVAILRHASAVGATAMERPVGYLGVTLSAGDMLLDRGFETWVHSEDLRTALGIPLAMPDPRDVTLLADLGVRALPWAWAGIHAAERSGPLAVELTGTGGGAWTVTASGEVRAGAQRGSTPRATLRLEALEFCRLAGGRTTVAAAVHASHGEPALITGALAAVASLARL